MLKQRMLQAAVALVLGAAGVAFAAQPAQAAVVVPAGTAGHACGGYEDLDVFVDFQVCAWASAGSSARVWFTAHFRNGSASTKYVETTLLGFYKNGQYVECKAQGEIAIPPHGVKASNDSCWRARVPGSYQAWITANTYTSDFVLNLSPTIVVQ